MPNNNILNKFYLEQAQSMVKIGFYELDIASNQIFNVTHGVSTLLETDAQIASLEDFSMFMSSKDREILQATILSLSEAPCGTCKVLKHKVRLPNNNSKYIAHSLKVCSYQEEDKKHKFFIVGLLQDYTDRYNHEHEISKMAYYDLLTSLPNRAGFEKSFNTALMLAKNVHQIALVFVDLDDFKKVNDTLGHNVGDKLLRHITTVINDVCKKYEESYAETDYIFSNIIPARFGGDEFVISVPYANNLDIIEKFVDELIKRINTNIKIKGNSIKPSVSVGISLFPDDGENFMSLLQKSDMAMYQSKARNKNTYSIYQKDLGKKASYRLKTESELFDALKNNELVLFYQPKIDLFTGRITSYESLIRWNHPSRGFLSPGHFIDIAEESDLIYEITDWVIDQCLHDYNNYFCQHDVEISINLSAKQFNTNLLTHKIFNITSSKIDTSKFEFEVTENILIDNVEQALNILNIIKSKGFKIAIDDFGSGYSSFNYIKTFPVDTIKLDKIFVDNLEDKKDQAIIKSIIFMARELKLKSICEGVETIEQLDFLLPLNCNEVQGYIISKPVSLDTLSSKEFAKQYMEIVKHIQRHRSINDKSTIIN